MICISRLVAQGQRVLHISNPVCMGTGQLRTGQLREIVNRMKSGQNMQKITDFIRLVTSTYVRRAEDAVLRTGPFSKTL